MSYHIEPDFPSKKAFKEFIAKGGKVYTVHPGPFPAKHDGKVAVEAPAHYHKWYAMVEIKDDVVIKVIA